MEDTHCRIILIWHVWINSVLCFSVEIILDFTIDTHNTLPLCHQPRVTDLYKKESVELQYLIFEKLNKVENEKKS